MKPDLEKPTLAGLSYLLRNRNEWPTNFKSWCWSLPWKCAMGLAQAQWNLKSCTAEGMCEPFGITDEESDHLFLRAPCYDTTPEIMANHIDKFLTNRLVTV